MKARISREFTASYSKIDLHGYAKPSFFFEIMQEIATIHAEMMALDPTQLDIVWVLSRIALHLERPIAPYETLRCETWCSGIRGASWYRSFAFFVGTHSVGSAQSMWVILSPETHKILRPTLFDVATQYIETSSEDIPAPLPKIVTTNAAPHHEHIVRYSDLDVNQHLNNVKISDIVCDALDFTDADCFVSSLQINFAKETLCGETLSLHTSASAQTCTVLGQAGETQRFTAQATFETITTL